MEVPSPLFEGYVSRVSEPTQLDSRFQKLYENVWAWSKQMRRNSKHTHTFSSVIQEASYAVSEVITHLDRVIWEFYTGNITLSMKQDIEDLEHFAGVICRESSAKLKLKGLGNLKDQILLVFPEGALFLAGPTVDELFCETGIVEKAHRLLDQELKNRFLKALRRLANTSHKFWSDGHKVTLNATLVKDRDYSIARQEQMKRRMRELDEVRYEMSARGRNALFRDPRVKISLTNKTTIATALNETGRERRRLKLEVERFPLQSHFYEQIRIYYGLEFDADANIAEALAGE